MLKKIFKYIHIFKNHSLTSLHILYSMLSFEFKKTVTRIQFLTEVPNNIDGPCLNFSKFVR